MQRGVGDDTKGCESSSLCLANNESGNLCEKGVVPPTPSFQLERVERGVGEGDF